MVYMDTTTVTARTTTRPTTLTMTTTTARATTTKTPTTTTAVAYWPRTTSTAGAPVQTPVEGLVPEDDKKAPPSSKLPAIRVEYCSPLVMMDVSWPRTKQGLVSRVSCPPGTIGKVVCRGRCPLQQSASQCHRDRRPCGRFGVKLKFLKTGSM